MYNELAKQTITELKASNQYREFRTINRIAGHYPTAWLNDDRSKQVTVWCSNDYLGMGENPATKKVIIEVLNDYGANSGGSRNISGTHLWLNKLEQSLAEWHEKEACLVYPTGYTANDSTLQCLAKIFKDCVFFSDCLNHASIITGIRAAKVEKHIFAHNNLTELESLLQQQPLKRPKIIVFESVYSMDGDMSPIKEIVTLAKKYNALTYLDEVHAVGLFGPQGAGVASLQGVQAQVDIIQGTLGKSIGAIGGYVAATAAMVDVIRSYSSGFIFTTTLPPLIAAAAYTNVEHFKKSSFERDKLAYNSQLLRKKLKANKIPVMASSQTHIIPVLVGDMVKCKAASQTLLTEYQIYIQPINFPTVAKGSERFRINATPQHSEQQIDELVNALVAVFNKHQISLSQN